jgi:hypothetical protein
MTSNLLDLADWIKHTCNHGIHWRLLGNIFKQYDLQKVITAPPNTSKTFLGQKTDANDAE